MERYFKIGGINALNILLTLIVILLFTLQTLSMKFIKASSFKQRLLINTCFTGMVSFCTLIYLILFHHLSHVSLLSILFGLLFGLCFTLTIIFYNLAITKGPLSFTAFFFSASMLIPALSGILIFKESLSISIFLGILTLLVAFYFINIASSIEKNKFEKTWPLYCLLTFIFNGLLGIIQKTHQYFSSIEETTLFMFIGFCASFLLYCLFYFILILIHKEQLFSKEVLVTISKNSLPITLLAMTSGLGNILLTFLSGKIPSSFLFPFVQGSIIILITLFSVLFLKEKLGLEGKIGITLGVMAIIVMNL